MKLFKDQRYRVIRSRLASVVAALVMLPYICLCCVNVPNATAAETEIHDCCPNAKADSSSPNPRNTADSCCNLEAGANSVVSTQAWIDVSSPAQRTIPAQTPKIANDPGRVAVSRRSLRNDTGPPLFLRNASFLI